MTGPILLLAAFAVCFAAITDAADILRHPAGGAS